MHSPHDPAIPHFYSLNNTLMVESTQTQSILCVIDFSESSVHALQWAINLGLKFDAHVTIVHPYRLNHSNKEEDMVAIKKTIDQDAALNFNRIASPILKDSAISYDFRPEVGFITDRVHEHIRTK